MRKRNHDFFLAIIVSEWVVRLVMLAVVTRWRRPNPAVAWLLVIFFQPWVGLIIYLLIGEYRLPQFRIKRRSRLLKKLDAVNHRFKQSHHHVEPRLEQIHMAAVTLAESLGGMPIVDGNDVQLIAHNGDVIDRLITDIETTCCHVHLLFYIYANDATGQRVTYALTRAVKRGVKYRVLIDVLDHGQ